MRLEVSQVISFLSLANQKPHHLLDAMIVSHLPFGPTAYFSLSNVTLRHEIPDAPPMSQQHPHLIFDNFNSVLGQRIMTILQHLFPPLSKESKRTVTFANQQDFISFRHHVFHKVDNQVHLLELGPRFEMMCFKITRGTLAETDPDIEWTYRPYHRTAHKRNYL
jgi:U3 small nucleolar ribonucleoprotein protein IMP4